MYMCFSSLEFLLFIATAEAARGAAQQLRHTRPINAALGWTQFKAEGQSIYGFQAGWMVNHFMNANHHHQSYDKVSFGVGPDHPPFVISHRGTI